MYWYYIIESGTENEPILTEVEFDFDTPIMQNYLLYAKYSGEAVMMARKNDIAFWKSDYRTKIISIEFKKGEIMVPDTAIESWDIRANSYDSEVRAYIEEDETEDENYQLTIVSPYTIYANVNTSGYFSNFPKLKEINFTNFDTSKSQNMVSMFSASIALNSIDLTSFDTSNVRNMSSMFYCGNETGNPPMALTEIIGMNKLNTAKVNSMRYMFNGCSNLINLDVNHFDTSNVITLESMFKYCSSIQGELDLNSWNIENVEYFSGMFFASSFSKIIMSGHNSKATSTTAMFQGCKATEVDISGIKGTNVTSIRCMFHGMTTPKIIDISNFSFDSVEDDNYFIYWGSSKNDIVYVKDENAQKFVLEHNSSWTVENVKIKNI